MNATTSCLNLKYILPVLCFFQVIADEFVVKNIFFIYLIYPGDLSAPEISEREHEKNQQDPALMPLPDTGADGPLDWAHLVDAAKAFEGKQN